MRLRLGTISIAGLLAVLLLPAAAAPAQRRADSPAAAGGDAVTAGAEAWEKQEYARALGIWRPLAAAGNVYAQYNLGQAYRLGRGVSVDEKVAQDWYFKAARQGHPQSQANYGLLLFQNGNRKGALPWLQKAADQGDPRAQYVVGTALFNGDLAPRDWTRAYALMTRAAAAGLKPAITSLAEMDRYVPLQQRTQGAALARDLERSATLAMAEDNTALVRAKPAVPVATATPADRPLEPRPRVIAAAVPPAPPPAPRVSPPPPPAVKVAKAPPPARKPAEAPVSVPATAPGKWRVQVGAYADPAAAGKIWDGIARKTPGLGLRSYLVKAGAVTRLQAGPLASRADANKACARITAAGSQCFPVAAP